jgi:hypothetical protein
VYRDVYRALNTTLHQVCESHSTNPTFKEKGRGLNFQFPESDPTHPFRNTHPLGEKPKNTR